MEENLITGHVVLLMAPMASGKRTLVTAAKAAYPELRFLVSCTTRVPRPGERDGVDYHFLSREQFTQKIEEGAFIEWAEFSGNLYGTLKAELMGPLTQGEVVLNEIEAQGVEQLRALLPASCMTIVYIDAGGWEVSLARALRRAPMSDEELKLRHERYLIERTWRDYADIVIENPDGKMAEAQHAFVELIGSFIGRHNS